MKELKANVIEVEGCAVTVEIEGDVADYAKSFLNIFNNVRENRELIKVKNYYNSNEVTVYCELEAKDNLIKYLKMFGEIKSCEKILVYEVEEPEYDYGRYYEAIIVSDLD